MPRPTFSIALPPLLCLAVFITGELSLGQIGHAAVLRCEDDAGRTHFRQFQCPPGTALAAPDRQPQANLSVVESVPLSPAEQAALRELDRTLARDRAQRARDRTRSARARSARAADAAARCREATGRLEALAETRRKGYRATAEAGLEAEEARWRAQRKSFC